jgi:uncharacterized membrane protein
MAENVNLLAAGIFYPLFAYGLTVFVVEPGVRGALFGLATYAAYDLTNLATLEGWSLLVTGVDMLWGTALCASVTLVSVWAGKRWIEQNQASG